MMRLRAGWCGALVFALAELGCSSSGIKSGGGTGGAAGATGGGGADGTGGGAVTDGPTCGVKTFTLNKVPPDLMIVLDKSGSMNQLPDGSPCVTAACASKWTQMTAAINQVLMSTENSIRWGIDFFPADGSCAVFTMPGAP